MPIKLDRLISAIAGAVVEAQHQVQQAHIGDLWNYFDKEGSPIPAKLYVPRVDPGTGRQEPVRVEVPLITLVKQSQLSIQEMQVTLHVDMSEISKDLLKEDHTTEPPTKDIIAHHEWKQQEYKAVIAASTTSGKKPGDVGLAQVTLKVTAGEIPEGLARLLDHLNKSL